jgi:hypothetical protein
MPPKSFRACIATSYRWAIAGAVGAAFSGFDLPGISAFIEAPVAGTMILGLLLLTLLSLILVTAVLEWIVSQYIAPD